MKIIIDARSRGSTGRVANKLIEHLQQIDSTNDYVIIKKPEQAIDLTTPNFRAVDTKVKDYTLAEQIKLWWILRRLKPDVVHFTMPQQPILPLGAERITMVHDLTMLRFHNINGNKYVYYFKLNVFRFLLWWITLRSAVINTPSKWTKMEVIKTFHTDPIRIRVTPLAAEPIPVRATPLSQYENVDYLLFNGNVFPHKNLRRLIDAFVLLKAKHPSLKLVIAGKISAQGEMLKAETAHRNIEDVDWLGFVPDDQMKWLWQNARVYVYPGLSEGFGLPGLESMLVGTPVAASNATCLPEVYGDAAEYFNPYDSRDMARAIERLLSDDARRNELMRLGKKRVGEYSWKRFAQEVLEIYESVGSSSDSPASVST